MAGRTCIFCGASARTNEDVVPRWIFKVLRRVPDYPASLVRTERVGTAAGHTFTTRQFSSGDLELRVKFVCGDCNSGWMSALEQRCEPLLTPMILGEKATLTGADQEAVSFWATKTAMTVQCANPTDRWIPREHHQELYRNARPLAWLVRLSRVETHRHRPTCDISQ